MTDVPEQSPLCLDLPEVPTQSEILAKVRQEAERLGEDPRAILREVKANRPTGRLILKLLGLPAEGVPVGRKTDSEQQHAVVATVERLVRDGRSVGDAHRLAPTILAKMGIYGRGALRPKLTVISVRRIRREWLARWWDASA